MKQILLLTALLLASPATSPAADAARPAKPNILFIVGDDMGYADVGFQGCKDIPTPNLDALAASGVRFTSGYVSGPYCSPICPLKEAFVSILSRCKFCRHLRGRRAHHRFGRIIHFSLNILFEPVARRSSALGAALKASSSGPAYLTSF